MADRKEFEALQDQIIKLKASNDDLKRKLEAMAGREVQTIEKTSKRLKGWLAICYSVFFASLLIMLYGGGMESTAVMVVGFSMFLASAVGIVYIKVQTWWRHG